MNLATLLTDLERHNIRPVLRDGAVNLIGPRRALTTELVEQARAHKSGLFAVATADEALAVLQRLKTFTLPAGRMPAARAVAERLRPLLAVPALDPAEALAALKTTEAELTALGGVYEPELAEAIGLVNGVFPRTRLIRLQ